MYSGSLSTGLSNTFFIFLAGLFFGEFHKGFAALRCPHCRAYMVYCIPGSEASWGLPIDCPSMHTPRLAAI